MATDRQLEMRRLLGQNPLPCTGYGLDGNPALDDTGYRGKPATEDLDNPDGHDSLVPVEGVEVKSLYFPTFTDDPSQFLRLPALLCLLAYNAALQEKVGVRVRARDCYRPYAVQVQGFRWGVEQILLERGKSVDSFTKILAQALYADADQQQVEWLLDIINRGNRFFSYVKALPEVYERFSGINTEIVTAAANFAVVDGLELDKYAPTAHASGGVADVDWVDVGSGKPFNVGVPVDHVGLESAIVFFEPCVPTVIAETLEEKGLTELRDRMFYYQAMVAQKPLLATFLAECGVDVDRLLTDDDYLVAVCTEIQANRRIVVAIASAFGIIAYGEECWHLDFDNRYGGVAVKDGLVSGGGTMAAYLGQDKCAWGCATKLWEKIVEQKGQNRSSPISIPFH